MKGIKKILISILIVMMIGQYVQFFTGIIPFKPLHGVTIKKSFSEFNLQSWSNWDFQESIIQYVGDNFGFRSFFIRLNNQLFYSIFKESTNEAVVIGKENYLFEKKYIDSYCGDDFFGSGSIDSNFIKLHEVSSFLNNCNTKLIIAIAPNKAKFYSEFLPSYLDTNIKTSNYDYYMKKFNENNYNIIDVNEWFLKIKGKKEHPLVSKQGTHYSQYGASLFADSLTKHIEYVLNRKMFHFIIDSLAFTKPEDDTDHDLERFLNIFTSTNKATYGFPASYSNIPNEDNYKPNMIVIGDSFFWLVYKSYFMSCFEETDFWYYFTTVYSWKYGLKLPTKEIDVIHAVANTDVVVLLTSVTNMQDLGFGFIDHVYDFLILDSGQKRKQLLPLYVKSIHRNNNQLELIKEKAVNRQIPLDSMIYLDAGWMVDRQLEKLFPESFK